ncbi:hypothetical protein R6Q57_021890 [Mikania cordata]
MVRSQLQEVAWQSVSLGSGLAAYQDMTSGEDLSSSHSNCSGVGYQKAQTSISPQISSNLVKLASDQQSEKEVDSRWNDKSVDNDDVYIENNSAAHAGKVDGDCDEGEGDGDGDDGYDYVGLSKDWIVPAVDELGKGKSVSEDYSDCQWEELPNEDFKIKRIEKWVMDLKHSSSLEETNGQNGKSNILDPLAASKNDAKAILGMDAAKRYISSLNAAATITQLANHGGIAGQVRTMRATIGAIARQTLAAPG